MQLKQSLCWFLSAGMLLAASAVAAAESRPISLEDCIQLALEKNLDLRIQRVAPEVARFNLSGSYAAYDPSFSMRANLSKRNSPGGVDSENRPFPSSSDTTTDLSASLGGQLPTGMSYSLQGTGADSSLVNFGVPFSNARAFTGISLSQPILKNFWIDGPRLNITLSRNQLHISRLQLEAQLIDTTTQVELAYLELIAARETVKVQEKAVQLAERLWQENKKRVAVGVMAPLDEKQAESQLAASRAALLGARNTVSLRQSALKALLDDRFSQWYNVELIPTEKLADTAHTFHTFSLPDSWSKGLLLRPDLQQSKTELENRNITLKYRRNQVFPQLDLVGSYGLTGNAFEMPDAVGQITDQEGFNYSVGVVFSMPLSNRAARNQRRVARANVETALLRLKQLEQRVMVEIHDAITQARTTFEQVEAAKAAVDYAQEALDAEQKKLENGKSTSFQVLQLQRDLTARESEHIRAMTDFNATLARLAQAEGSTLERHHITFNDAE